MAGDISRREWICWDGEELAEPTSTLVLTSPNNTFVDIRLILASLSSSDATNTFVGLDWALSGVSSPLPTIDIPRSQHKPLVPTDLSSLDIGNDMLRVPRKQWKHVVDSRFPAWDDAPAPDEGEMYPVLGRPEECLEIGAMEKHPGDGVATGYQELWLEVEPLAVGSETRRHGTVLTLSMPDSKARGCIVRVAQFCQAVLTVDGQVDAERWEYVVGEQGKPGEWQRQAKFGSRTLPCSWTFEGGQAESEETAICASLQDGEFNWKVAERFAW